MLINQCLSFGNKHSTDERLQQHGQAYFALPQCAFGRTIILLVLVECTCDNHVRKKGSHWLSDDNNSQWPSNEWH